MVNWNGLSHIVLCSTPCCQHNTPVWLWFITGVMWCSCSRAEVLNMYVVIKHFNVLFLIRGDGCDSGRCPRCRGQRLYQNGCHIRKSPRTHAGRSTRYCTRSVYLPVYSLCCQIRSCWKSIDQVKRTASLFHPRPYLSDASHLYYHQCVALWSAEWSDLQTAGTTSCHETGSRVRQLFFLPAFVHSGHFTCNVSKNI